MFKDFFNSLVEGKLIGLKCNDCGSYTCPPKATCNNCGSRNFVKVELSGKGKIISFTTTYVAPAGYEKECPYVVAIVELDEGPCLIGRLDISHEKAEELGQALIGKEVTVYGKIFPNEPFYPDKERRVVPMLKLEE